MKELEKLTGKEFVEYEGVFTTSLTADEDWEEMFSLLSSCCELEDWNGAFVPGIFGSYKGIKISVVYCGSCCR